MKLTSSQPSSESFNLFTHSLQVPLFILIITAFQYIFKLSWFQSLTILPHLPSYGLQVHTITALLCISQFTQLLSPSMTVILLQYHQHLYYV